jgi:autotransporter-associated beta strand protein
MSKKINSCFLRVSILFCLGSISSPAVAQNVLSTWTPTNTDFNNSANWSPNGALTTTNVAFFSGPASNSLSPQLTANSTIYGLNFTNAATGYTISTANNSVLTLSSAYGFVTNPIVRAPAIWAQNTTGTNRISTGLVIAANTSTWFQAKGGTMEVTGNISESGGSRQLSLASVTGGTGTSYYTLAGNNTYSGLTTVTSGTLTLSGDNSGASGGVSISGLAVLNINSAKALGTGTLITSSGSKINNTSGSAVINAGNNAVTLATTTTFGTTSSTSANDLDLGTGAVTASGGLLINFAGNGTTLKMGTLNSTRANVAGSPTGATLTANNTESGAGNTLMFDGFKLGSAALNNITVQINGNANVAFNGIIENSGSFANGITINSTATTTFAGDNTYSGATTISSGALLKIGSATALGSTLTGTTVSSGGVLDMNGQAVGNEAISINTGTGGISGSGSLINSSANSASLSGAMTLLGNTTVGEGNITLRGNIGQSGGNRMLTKLGAGLLTLAGTNTYNGGTTISSGSLQVATSGSIASSSTSTVNGGSLTVNGTAGGVVVNTGGSLGGSGTVGAVTLNSGGLLNPGNSPGTLNATSASLLAGSTYNWEIQNAAGGPSAAGTNWDLLNVTNELNLSTLTTNNRLNLVLKSLDSAGLATISLLNFSSGTDYSWVFAQAGSINNANFTVGADVTDYFNIDTTAFNGGAQLASYFKVEVGTDSVSNLRTLSLVTIPEPSTGSMLALGFAGLAVTRLLRRKQS